MAFFCRALILLAVTVTFHQQVCGQIQGKSCNADQLSKKQDVGTFCSCCDLNSTCSFDSMKFELYCKCDKGFNDTGSGLAGDCMDIDECKLGTDLCDDKDFGGICNNTVGSYSCGCSDGYRFKNGSRNKCVEIDECKENTDNCNSTISTCVNTQGSYECNCNKYYEKNESSGECVDIDECSSEDLHTCQFKCVNLQPAFRCECGDGYKGDGNTCKDIDECTTRDDDCHKDADCTNTDGSFNCTCKTGFQGNGTTCEDIKECADNSLNECGDGTFCEELPGSYRCNCSSGYQRANNITCEDIDECTDKTDTCDEKSTKCNNTIGNFTCECYPGLSRVNDTACSGNDALKSAVTRLEELERLKLLAEIHYKQLIAETLEKEKIKLIITCKNKSALLQRPKRSIGEEVSKDQLQMHINLLNHYISRQTLENQLTKNRCESK